MPYKSKAQAAYMHIHHPEIAKRWDDHTPNFKKLPEHVKTTKKTEKTEKTEKKAYELGIQKALQDLALDV